MVWRAICLAFSPSTLARSLSSARFSPLRLGTRLAIWSYGCSLEVSRARKKRKGPFTRAIFVAMFLILTHAIESQKY